MNYVPHGPGWRSLLEYTRLLVSWMSHRLVLSEMRSMFPFILWLNGLPHIGGSFFMSVRRLVLVLIADIASAMLGMDLCFLRSDSFQMALNVSSKRSPRDFPMQAFNSWKRLLLP